MKKPNVTILIVERVFLIGSLIAFVFLAVTRAVGYWDGEIMNTKAAQYIEDSIGAMVAALVISEFIRSIKRPEADTKRDETLQAVKGVHTALEKKMDIWDAPKTTEDYVKFFAGFVGCYYVYNPCYDSEENQAGIDQLEIIETVFIARYRDPNFEKAHYLFLTKDAAGKKDLKKFRDLMAKVKAKCPEVAKKLEVRVLDKAAAGDSEVYRGTKYGGATISVVEPAEQALTGGRGNPFYYLIVTDAQINRRLREQFDAHWRQAKPHDLFTASTVAVATGEEM